MFQKRSYNWNKKYLKTFCIAQIKWSDFYKLQASKTSEEKNYNFWSLQSILEPASVPQLDAPSKWRPGGRGFNPLPSKRVVK